MASAVISGPIQMATLSSTGKQGELQARQSTDEEHLEHDENVADLLDYFRNCRNWMASTPTMAKLRFVPEVSNHRIRFAFSLSCADSLKKLARRLFSATVADPIRNRMQQHHYSGISR